MSGGIIELVMDSGWPTKSVLLVLLGFSVATWAVIFQKWRAFRRLYRDNQNFLVAYAKTDSLVALAQTPNLPLERGLGFVFRDGMEKAYRHEGHDYSVEWLASLERRLRGTISEDVTQQEEYLAILATTANVAPFIGLLGTVWGIIVAFREIAAQGSASISAVAPGVAEALVATAGGLFAAIPAVVAYNYFINRVRGQAAQMETFSLEFIDLLHDNGTGA